ncbi:hypothetical protein UC34_20735 [Pandoraea vervacti]|uniref:CAAX prenyl protease 2/Lysostaphin resistance protein A-like domain-containing protein n=2 Tax=Pandoraea vervacti TaxID=656178 RepID=A0ABN4FVZ4_9BURK|nr:hypothetical protein UC34_20735 [Pandoraea vervacti]
MRAKPGKYCFPNLLEAFFVVVALYFVEMIVNAIVVQLSYLVHIRPMAAYSIGRVLAYGLVFCVVLHHSKLSYRELFQGRGSVRATLGLFTLPIALLTPGMLLVCGVINVGVEKLFPTGGLTQDASDMFAQAGLGSFILICLIAPFVEEMLYRGILLRSFLRQYPSGTAIAHSAAVFGLAHLNVYQFVGALIIGLVLGKLYERTRSLVPGILLHMFYNTAVVVITVNLPAGGKTPNVFDLPAIWWVVGLASGAAGTLMLKHLLWHAPGTRAGAAPVTDE